MEVRNLVTFLKVTELKSFSRAAEALDYSQSAVTVQIQQLERELGVQLFDRIGKTVSITQYGKDFVSYARDVVSAIARASAFASADSELSGTVRNVIDFGVFVDIGVHQDGLVHISQVCNKYIRHPSEVVSDGDVVKVKVLEVDEKRERISLTMKGV